VDFQVAQEFKDEFKVKMPKERTFSKCIG